MHLPVPIRILGATCLLCVAGIARTQTPDIAPARVMVVGLFHFANPGRDMVKTRVIDVMAPHSQAYLDGLAGRMAAFKPTHVLAECSPTDQAAFDQRFTDYVAGSYVLPSNETYQIGFRVAKQAGLRGVTCFDEQEVGWNAQPMFDYMDKHDARAKQDMEATFKTLSAQMDGEQATLPLVRLLQLTSDPARDALNKGLYLRTNAVGAGDGFAGADASASWWHRNFRMYANVQKAAVAGSRVVVLAGQGHAAILKDLLAMDDSRVAEDVRRYLEPPAN